MYQLLSTYDYGKNFDGISEFTDQHVLHVIDTFDQEFVNTILQRGTPRCIISDHFVHAQFNGLQVIGLPLIYELVSKEITNDLILNDRIDTNLAFNFMINKKQINRFLCMKLVELFKLTNFDYTWSGLDRRFDMSHIIEELDILGTNSPLDINARSFILQPVGLEKQWLGESGQPSAGNRLPIGKGYGYPWKIGLDKMFSQSAVSLITESVALQTASVFTEKTVYAVLGQTFPIWIGGCNQANDFSRMGFDVFDDIIDHSYQSYETLIERCYYAFEKNLSLLSNLDLLRNLRLQKQQRLIKNRELLCNGETSRFINHQIAALPDDIKQVMPDILKHFRASALYIKTS
jgi:hypothetical protein